MSTLRRLILCTALLIAFILLGAQALGMLAAHRYLNTQLAQQGQAGASALAWAPVARRGRRPGQGQAGR